LFVLLSIEMIGRLISTRHHSVVLIDRLYVIRLSDCPQIFYVSILWFFLQLSLLPTIVICSFISLSAILRRQHYLASTTIITHHGCLVVRHILFIVFCCLLVSHPTTVISHPYTTSGLTNNTLTLSNFMIHL
jgi:hypothetical protein